jgi:undecaprenyl diphosphate synthase
LRLAIDYSSRDSILEAVNHLPRPISRVDLSTRLGPEVDLVIRTSGEQRLSDFLLWESAYAEFYVTGTPWPSFNGMDLALAVEAFRSRERRFGALGAA